MEGRALAEILLLLLDALRVQRLAGGGMEKPSPDAGVVGQTLSGEHLVQIEWIAQGVVGKSATQSFHLFGDLLFADDDQFAVLDGLLDLVEAVDSRFSIDWT